MPDDAPVTKTVWDIDSPGDYDCLPAAPTTSAAEPTRFRYPARQSYRYRNLLQPSRSPWPRALRQPRPLRTNLASRRRLRLHDLVQQRCDDRGPPAGRGTLLALDHPRGATQALDGDLQSRRRRMAHELSW